MKTKPLSRRSFVALASLALCASLFATLHAQTPAKNKIDPNQKFPDVVDVKVRAASANTFDFDVTLSSPYDTPARYADAFRVSTESGKVLGERVLLHDHQDEQPFTRDLYGVKIPADVRAVVVQGRDQKFGYGGKTMLVKLPGR
jgi:hypothetical protein